MFILLMLFLFKYIDDLIGKGFEWYVILELLLYASATNVAMALPLAVLLSSIMTFGSLGENYELVAIKSAGVSLQRAMMPLVIVVTFLSAATFVFSDYMLPVANLKMGSLLYDVRNQKAAFLINEGVFNSSIPGYSIRVKKKDSDGQTLHDLIIYDHNNTNGTVNVLVAKEGRMYKSEDDQFLILKLKNGKRYEESQSEKGIYNPRQTFIRQEFKETEQKFDLSGFKMQRTDENLFKSNYAMLNLKQLAYYRDSTEIQADSNASSVLSSIRTHYKQNFIAPGYQIINPKKLKNYKSNILEIIPADKRALAIRTAQDEVRSIRDVLKNKEDVNEDFEKRIRRFWVEYHRKFTLSVSCLILFFVGAPLGAIIRKGGLGLPVVMSILFFLTYHIISTIGEKYAKEGSLSPVVGMWIAILVLAPVGMFLTYKATADSALFDLDYYKQWFKKLLPQKSRHADTADPDQGAQPSRQSAEAISQ